MSPVSSFMNLRITTSALFILLVSHTQLVRATTTEVDSHIIDTSQESVSSPLAPEYSVESDGSVSLRVCYNWSCASRQTMNFTPEDINLVKKTHGDLSWYNAA